MASVTGLTAARMLAIEAASVVSGRVEAGILKLMTHGGLEIEAGSVVGPKGDKGDAQELATMAEAIAGTNNTKAVTPKTLDDRLRNRVLIAPGGTEEPDLILIRRFTNETIDKEKKATIYIPSAQNSQLGIGLRTDNNIDCFFYFNDDATIHTQTNGSSIPNATRRLPFATLGGEVWISDIAAGAEKTTTITFPTNIFTKRPVVSLMTVGTASGMHQVRYWVEALSTASMILRIRNDRTSALTSIPLMYTATQFNS